MRRDRDPPGRCRQWQPRCWRQADTHAFVIDSTIAAPCATGGHRPAELAGPRRKGPDRAADHHWTAPKTQVDMHSWVPSRKISKTGAPGAGVLQKTPGRELFGARLLLNSARCELRGPRVLQVGAGFATPWAPFRSLHDGWLRRRGRGLHRRSPGSSGHVPVQQPAHLREPHVLLESRSISVRSASYFCQPSPCARSTVGLDVGGFNVASIRARGRAGRRRAARSARPSRRCWPAPRRPGRGRSDRCPRRRSRRSRRAG